jgi:hypothetical protein
MNSVVESELRDDRLAMLCTKLAGNALELIDNKSHDLSPSCRYTLYSREGSMSVLSNRDNTPPSANRYTISKTSDSLSLSAHCRHIRIITGIT